MPNRKESTFGLLTPIGDVSGVRTDRAEGLLRLGIRTVADLVRYLPMRWERIEAESTIADVQPGTIATAKGEITATRLVRHGKRPRFEAVLMDHTGRLDLVWFNATYMQKKIFPGLTVRVQGQAKPHGPLLQMANPKSWVVKADESMEAVGGESAGAEVEAKPTIRPVYSASEQVPSNAIEQTVGLVLGPALEQIEDHLSAAFRKKRSLPELREAYRMAHKPETLEETREATRRLAYDELLMLQLGVFLRRAQLRGTVRAPKLDWGPAVDEAIRKRFPFPLTKAQERVVGEIVRDLRSEEPTNRLIQGDVGSGKTVVALYAMLVAVANKAQGALMAPTEILAEQHFFSISRMLEGSKVKVALLTGAATESERQAILRDLESGQIDILVGTHALLTERVRFENLAVAIIDEQHRFGVHQRAALRSKGESGLGSRGSGLGEGTLVGEQRGLAPEPRDPAPAPRPETRPLAPHVIVMTATPIPRTLALTLLGDLDISTIDELPPGRTPIITRVVDAAASGEVYTYVRSRLDAGEQAYVVVPAIDTGASAAERGEGGGDVELNDLRTVMARLEAHEFAGKKVAALHGRLKQETREAIMGRFRAGQIDALVATTVIEVGVDVPNATMMVIEHADRFGLAQLHQLRGRVGRGSKKSVCVLISSPPPLTPEGEQRLSAMAATTDGFEIAERDLALRGPGEVFGLRQAGAPPFKVADLMRDRDLLALARRDAMEWIERSPMLRDEGEDLLRKRLMKLHGEWLGIGDVG